MKGPFILAIDQGTSSTKTVVFDERGVAVARGVEPLQTQYLDGGFVEQDPEEIFLSACKTIKLRTFTSIAWSLTSI